MSPGEFEISLVLTSPGGGAVIFGGLIVAPLPPPPPPQAVLKISSSGVKYLKGLKLFVFL